MMWTVTKPITTRANQKPWMTAEVRGLLKTRDETFRSGDKAALKTARGQSVLWYQKCKTVICSKNQQSLHRQQRTHGACGKHSGPSLTTSPAQACDEDTSLPDALNHFYSRFEMQNDTPAQKLPHLPTTRRFVCLQPT